MVKYIEHEMIRVVETVSAKITELQPKIVESCMNPGTFLVTPIEMLEDDSSIEYRMENSKIVVSKSDIEKGIVSVDEIPFVPKRESRKPSCNPCRNCGRC